MAEARKFRLEQEDDHTVEFHRLQTQEVLYQSENRALEADNARLRAALKKHGQHSGCRVGRFCTCGLDAALKEPDSE